MALARITPDLEMHYRDECFADSWRTPGIYHAILKKLAWDKVNLINLISTHTELTLLLEKEHTGAAFSVLSNMIAHKH